MKHFVAVGQTADARLIGRIVMGVDTVEQCPRMYDMAALRVIACKECVKSRVETSFITVGPGKDTWMIGVVHHHLAYNTAANGCGIMVLPSWQLVEIKHSERVAYVEQMSIRRIVRAYGVGVHRLHQLYIPNVEAAARCTPGLRIETMSVDTFYRQLAAVKIESVTTAEFNCTKTLHVASSRVPPYRQELQDAE